MRTWRYHLLLSKPLQRPPLCILHRISDCRRHSTTPSSSWRSRPRCRGLPPAKPWLSLGMAHREGALGLAARRRDPEYPVVTCSACVEPMDSPQPNSGLKSPSALGAVANFHPNRGSNLGWVFLVSFGGRVHGCSTRPVVILTAK